MRASDIKPLVGPPRKNHGWTDVGVGSGRSEREAANNALQSLRGAGWDLSAVTNKLQPWYQGLAEDDITPHFITYSVYAR